MATKGWSSYPFWPNGEWSNHYIEGGRITPNGHGVIQLPLDKGVPTLVVWGSLTTPKFFKILIKILFSILFILSIIDMGMSNKDDLIMAQASTQLNPQAQ
jgi:hypothetical protein